MGRTAHERAHRTRSPRPIAFGLQSGVSTITGEEVVAAGAGEEDFDATFPRFPTHGMGGEGGDVGGRFVQRPDHGVEIGERRTTQGGVMQRCAKSAGHELRVRVVFGKTFGGQSG